METMKDYHDLFLKCYVLLLADLLEKIKYNILKKYGLFPSYDLSGPASSWDAMRSITKVKLMFFFFEKSIRNGVSYISKRYSKVDIKYLRSYDAKQDSKYIIYLDANNLYGYVMSKFLPTSDFKWIDPKQFDLNKYASKSLKICVLKNDLKYPIKLRELYNDYPLSPDKKETLSNYQLKIVDLYNISIGNKFNT